MKGGSPITTRCLHPVAYASASAQKSRFCARRASQNSTERLSGTHRRARSSSAEHETARSGPARQGKTSRNGTRPPGTKRNGPKHNETQPPRNATHATKPKRKVTQHTQRKRHATAQWGTTKKETTFRVVSFKNWRLPTLPHGSAVPSAQVSLTSLFGMGRGGSSPLLPP